MSVTETPNRTAAAGVANYAGTSPENATRALSLRVEYLRSNVDMTAGEVHNLHEETRELDLRDRALQKSKSSIPTLLEELSFTRGMGWSEIAALAGVSVSAVRKWRQGGDASPERRAVLARAAAFLDVLQEKGVVEEPARWLEMALPLPDGYFIRPMDLYLDGQITALIELVEQRKPMDQVLDEARPGWREQRSQFQVFQASDGQRALRNRSN